MEPVTLSWEGQARSRIRSFLVDEDFCGWEEDLDLFVGTSHELTGPVFLSSSSDTLTAGTSGASGSAEVWAQGYTCSGDVAASTPMYIQPMLESISLPEGFDASGEVLPHTVLLDEDGEAVFTWTMEHIEQGGLAKLLVGSPTGIAFGEHRIEVLGDAVPPHVWAVEPVGAVVSPFDSIIIDFSEPMLDAGTETDRTTIATLVSSTGSEVPILDAAWSDDRTRLVVGLPFSLDPSTDVWELIISDEARDLAGNRLDGDWDTVSGGIWSTHLGAVTTLEAAMGMCSLSTGWFRPGGYSAEGAAAELVQIFASTSAPAAWWRLDVFASDGEHIYRNEVPRSGLSSGTMSWNGRHINGTAVENGQYLLELSPLDDFRNNGVPCVASVVVANPLEP